MKRRASLYVCNWSLEEPLCQSQTLAYLRELAAGGRESCVITFERAPYVIPSGRREAVRRELADQGICWHPLAYHGRSSSLGAIYDGMRALSAGAIAILRHGPRIVHTRTSVPAGLGLVLSKVFRRPFLYDADSELSEEYADGGHWARSSVRFRALAAVEARCRRHADAIVVLTERLRSSFAARGVTAPTTVIPCCVDTVHFRHDDDARRRRRAELGVDREKLLVYVGKIGPRYLIDEMFRFAKALESQAGPIRVLVLTADDPPAFRTAAAREGIGDQSIVVRRAAHGEVPEWLSAADAGLALVRTTTSEAGSSPIKASEYLACGLPVVITPGIGDMSAAIEEHALGVVLAGDDEAARQAAARRLAALWDAGNVRERCALWARSTLDVKGVGAARYATIYDRLNGEEREQAPASDRAGVWGGAPRG